MATEAKRTRKAPDVRRDEILDATIQLAIETSLNTVTIRDVAKVVGVGTGLVHHYFSSRRELIADAFERWCERVLTDYTSPEDVTPLEQLALFVTLQTPGEQRLWYDALSPSHRGDLEVLRERARKLSLAYYEEVLGEVWKGIAAGDFTCAKPEDTAWRIILVLDSLVLDLSVLSLPERGSRGGACEHADRSRAGARARPVPRHDHRDARAPKDVQRSLSRPPLMG